MIAVAPACSYKHWGRSRLGIFQFRYFPDHRFSTFLKCYLSRLFQGLSVPDFRVQRNPCKRSLMLLRWAGRNSDFTTAAQMPTVTCSRALPYCTRNRIKSKMRSLRQSTCMFVDRLSENPGKLFPLASGRKPCHVFRRPPPPIKVL